MRRVEVKVLRGRSINQKELECSIAISSLFSESTKAGIPKQVSRRINFRKNLLPNTHRTQISYTHPSSYDTVLLEPNVSPISSLLANCMRARRRRTPTTNRMTNHRAAAALLYSKLPVLHNAMRSTILHFTSLHFTPRPASPGFLSLRHSSLFSLHLSSPLLSSALRLFPGPVGKARYWTHIIFLYTNSETTALLSLRDKRRVEGREKEDEINVT